MVLMENTQIYEYPLYAPFAINDVPQSMNSELNILV